MKRACLVSLVVWAALSAAAYSLFHGRFTPPGDLWGAIAAGFFTGLLVGAIVNAIQTGREAGRVASASQGQMHVPPEDGQALAVYGRVRALRTPLSTPFTRKPAVYYSYEIEHLVQTREDSTWVKDYSGMALTPSVIDSTHGPVRLLTFPALEGFGKASYSLGPELDQAREYVRKTWFEKMSALAFAKIIGEVKDLMADRDGEIRKDWQLGDSDPELPDHTVREEVILNGEQVCAIGRWSRQRGGLLPEDDSVQVRIVRGAPQEVVGKLRRKSIATVAVGVIVGLIANGAIYGLLLVRESSPATRRKSQKVLHDAVQAGSVSGMRDALDRGARINEVLPNDRPPLFEATDENTARWLIDNGADVNLRNDKGETPLMFHAAVGHPAIVAVLIASHADLDATDPEYRMTALRRAQHAEHPEVVELLRRAGAKDDTITEKNGTPIDESHPAYLVVRNYLDAVFAEKPELLTTLSTLHFDGVDFATWKASRTNDPRLISGFANDSNATIVVRGPRPNGGSTTWTYQLRKEGIHWRVSEERWETRLENQ